MSNTNIMEKIGNDKNYIFYIDKRKYKEKLSNGDTLLMNAFQKNISLKLSREHFKIMIMNSNLNQVNDNGVSALYFYLRGLEFGHKYEMDKSDIELLKKSIANLNLDEIKKVYYYGNDVHDKIIEQITILKEFYTLGSSLNKAENKKKVKI